ncbi:MAG: SH3 domain-containing protein [Clostridia bacterium]|nr:SH3 domain-containing protein [Clostridia bacterium]
MMKRKLFAICMLLLSLVVPALAEPYTYSSDQTPLVFFGCEDFDSELPEALCGVFDEWLEEDDEIICGTVCTARYHSKPEEVLSADALLAIRQKGKTLLLGAAYQDGAWRSAVETDRFFSPGRKFDLTCLPVHGMEGKLNGVFPALVCGGGEFVVDVREDARVILQQYRAAYADGSELRIGVGNGSLYAHRMLDGIEQESGRAQGVFSGRLRGWTCDAFPKSCAQVNALEGTGMPEFAEGEALIFGVNLREQPTGQSRSLGKYTAIVRILDRREGTHAPWYQVQFEDKTGWVSGDYVLFPEHEPHLSQIASHLSNLLDE